MPLHLHYSKLFKLSMHSHHPANRNDGQHDDAKSRTAIAIITYHRHDDATRDEHGPSVNEQARTIRYRCAFLLDTFLIVMALLKATTADLLLVHTIAMEKNKKKLCVAAVWHQLFRLNTNSDGRLSLECCRIVMD